ncbi:hypothetical protein MPTK1_8g12370 [Marchantia polymorpha subsp. ruderalis]|uniref:Uncharacterized protein n=1 Tax=Marchantia polymorpha TaxID=3197 RepID=A0A2R6WJT2_MARPO|nr:hypothetical protein MARPO_0083s0083 [Marchantia polymorpha]BBN19642.1 hypothetical protein Mp_8g12370 [Marchantia polymorpha subsp. ruderalis]|eukprot:PTQ34125.1 hypothetical protein MARPO_0083s0083 [Marchantia polymorpha]
MGPRNFPPPELQPIFLIREAQRWWWGEKHKMFSRQQNRCSLLNCQRCEALASHRTQNRRPAPSPTEEGRAPLKPLPRGCHASVAWTRPPPFQMPGISLPRQQVPLDASQATADLRKVGGAEERRWDQGMEPTLFVLSSPGVGGCLAPVPATSGLIPPSTGDCHRCTPSARRHSPSTE